MVFFILVGDFTLSYISLPAATLIQPTVRPHLISFTYLASSVLPPCNFTLASSLFVSLHLLMPEADFYRLSCSVSLLFLRMSVWLFLLLRFLCFSLLFPPLIFPLVFFIIWTNFFLLILILFPRGLISSLASRLPFYTSFSSYSFSTSSSSSSFFFYYYSISIDNISYISLPHPLPLLLLPPLPIPSPLSPLPLYSSFLPPLLKLLHPSQTTSFNCVLDLVLPSSWKSDAMNFKQYILRLRNWDNIKTELKQ